MAARTELRTPDLVNAGATLTLLRSTGIALPDIVEHLLDELTELAAQHPPSAAARRFVCPDNSDLLQRWCVFVAAHAYDGDAPEWLPRPPWTAPTGMRGRPLTPLEQALCRVAIARWDTRDAAVSPSQYALAEASAATGELIRLPINAVSITGRAAVALGGGRDQLPRTATLDPWGTRLIIRRLERVSTRDRSTPFLYDGNQPGTNRAQASASGNLSRVLHVAGLGDDRTLNPTSIRNTCAARMFEAGERLEDIAAAMGAKSLDRLWGRLRAAAPS